MHEYDTDWLLTTVPSETWERTCHCGKTGWGLEPETQYQVCMTCSKPSYQAAVRECESCFEEIIPDFNPIDNLNELLCEECQD